MALSGSHERLGLIVTDYRPHRFAWTHRPRPPRPGATVRGERLVALAGAVIAERLGEWRPGKNPQAALEAGLLFADSAAAPFDAGAPPPYAERFARAFRSAARDMGVPALDFAARPIVDAFNCLNWGLDLAAAFADLHQRVPELAGSASPPSASGAPKSGGKPRHGEGRAGGVPTSARLHRVFLHG